MEPWIKKIQLLAQKTIFMIIRVIPGKSNQKLQLKVGGRGKTELFLSSKTKFEK